MANVIYKMIIADYIEHQCKVKIKRTEVEPLQIIFIKKRIHQ